MTTQEPPDESFSCERWTWGLAGFCLGPVLVALGVRWALAQRMPWHALLILLLGLLGLAVEVWPAFLVEVKAPRKLVVQDGMLVLFLRGGSLEAPLKDVTLREYRPSLVSAGRAELGVSGRIFVVPSTFSNYKRLLAVLRETRAGLEEQKPAT